MEKNIEEVKEKLAETHVRLLARSLIPAKRVLYIFMFQDFLDSLSSTPSSFFPPKLAVEYII